TSIAPNTINRAQIAAGRGDHSRALAEFTAALDDDEAPSWVRWQAHAGMALTLLDTGQVERAWPHFERALEAVENTRISIVRPEYRVSFLARMIRFHQAYVDALVANGRISQALEVANASRARVLTERAGVEPITRTRSST